MSKLKEFKGLKTKTKNVDSKSNTKTKSTRSNSNGKSTSAKAKKKCLSEKQKGPSPSNSKPRVLRKRDDKISISSNKLPTKNKKIKKEINVVPEELTTACKVCQKSFSSQASLSRHSSACSTKYIPKIQDECKNTEGMDIIPPIKKPRGRPPKNPYKEKVKDSHLEVPLPDFPIPLPDKRNNHESNGDEKASKVVHSKPSKTKTMEKIKKVKVKNESAVNLKKAQKLKPESTSASTSTSRSFLVGLKRKRLGDAEDDTNDNDYVVGNENNSEISDKPQTCTKCKMTYRTESGFQNHLSSCIKFVFSSSSELEDSEPDGSDEDEGSCDINPKEGNCNSVLGEIKRRPGYEENVVIPEEEEEKYCFPNFKIEDEDDGDIEINVGKNSSDTKNIIIPTKNDVSPNLDLIETQCQRQRLNSTSMNEFASDVPNASSFSLGSGTSSQNSQLTLDNTDTDRLSGSVRLPSVGHTNYSIDSIVSKKDNKSYAKASKATATSSVISSNSCNNNQNSNSTAITSGVGSGSAFVASVERFFSNSSSTSTSKSSAKNSSKRKSSGKKKNPILNSVQTETESQVQNQQNQNVPLPETRNDYTFSETATRLPQNTNRSSSSSNPHETAKTSTSTISFSSKLLSPRKGCQQESFHSNSHSGYCSSNNLNLETQVQTQTRTPYESCNPTVSPAASPLKSPSRKILPGLPLSSPSLIKARDVANILEDSCNISSNHNHGQHQHQLNPLSESLISPISPTPWKVSPASTTTTGNQNRYDPISQLHQRDLSPLQPMQPKIHHPHAVVPPLPSASSSSTSTSTATTPNPFFNLSGHVPVPPETETITMQDSTGQIVRIQVPTVPSVAAQAYTHSHSQSQSHAHEQQLHQQFQQQQQQQLSYHPLAMSLQAHPGQTHLMPYASTPSTSLAYQEINPQQQYYNWPIEYQQQIGSQNISNFYVQQQIQLQLQLQQHQQQQQQQQQLLQQQQQQQQQQQLLQQQQQQQQLLQQQQHQQLLQQQEIALQLQQHPQQLFQQYHHPYSTGQSQQQSFQPSQQHLGLPGGSLQSQLQTQVQTPTWFNGAVGSHAVHAPVPLQAVQHPSQPLGFATPTYQQPTVIQNSSFVVVQHGNGIGISGYNLPVAASINSAKNPIPAPIAIMPGPATTMPKGRYSSASQDNHIEQTVGRLGSSGSNKSDGHPACRGPSLATPCSCELCLQRKTGATNNCLSTQSKNLMDYKFIGKGKIQQQFQPPLWSSVSKRRKLAPAPSPAVPVGVPSTYDKVTEVAKVRIPKKSYKKKSTLQVPVSAITTSTATGVIAAESSTAMSSTFNYSDCQSFSLDPCGLNANLNNIAVVRPLENSLQKICEQVSSIGSNTTPLINSSPVESNFKLLNSKMKSNKNSILPQKPKTQKGKIKLDPEHKKRKAVDSPSNGKSEKASLKTKVTKSKSINITLKRKQGDTSYAIQQIIKSASSTSRNGDSGPMKSLKIKAKITNGDQAGTTTDVFVVPSVHVVPIPDSVNGSVTINEEECNNNNISADVVAGTIPSEDLVADDTLNVENNKMTHRAVILYEVKSGDKVLFRSSDVRTIWSHVFGIVQGSEMNLNLPPLSYPSTDISLRDSRCTSSKSGTGFGNTIHQAIQFLLKELPKPGSIDTKNKQKQPKRKNSKQAKEDYLELAAPFECLTGCARTEGFKGRKPVDMFGWLASKHRSLPTIESCVDTGKAEMPLANPNTMRNRNLREKSPRMLGVFYSTIHGRGLFTRRDIQEGEMVIEYAGEIIRSILCDCREKWYESKGYGCYMFKIDEYEVVDSTMRGNAARFINHSCDPNCKSKVVDVMGQKRILIFSLRKILGGEELTYDYNFQKEGMDKKILCTCGTSRCRKFLN